MRSPIIRARTLSPTPGEWSEVNLHRLQDEWDGEGLFARMRALRRKVQTSGAPALALGILISFGPIAILPLIAAVLP